MTKSPNNNRLIPLRPSAPPPAHPGSRRRRLRRWAFAPLPSPNRALDMLRTCLRVLLIMYQEFFRTHLAIRASALTYSIILSLVPMLALSTSILKGLGNDEQLKRAAIRFIDQWEPPLAADQSGLTLGLPLASGQTSQTPVAAAESPNGATAHLHHAVDLIFQYVDRTNFATLGILGVLGLLGVILLVLSTIEDAMNAIWHTRRGRSFLRKIMDYLALLFLLPLSLNVAVAAEAILANKHIMEQISTIIPTAWLATFFIKLVPFLFIVITLMVMYLFFPHVKVKTGAALAGAFFAATFWFIFQKLYIVLQVWVANYNAIYGSFASIPLFLIWLQIGWTFILLGASLAYAIQHHQHHQFSQGTISPQQRLQIALDILRTVYANFERRLPTTFPLLNDSLPHSRCADIKAVAQMLISGNLLGRSELRQEEVLIPVTSADRLVLGEVVQLLFGREMLPSLGGQLATSAIDAAANALNLEVSTSTLLSEHETGSPADHP